VRGDDQVMSPPGTLQSGGRARSAARDRQRSLRCTQAPRRQM
jgi:hypothetical protein